MTDVSIGPPTGEVPLHLTARCVVAVQADGIHLVSDVLAPKIPVSWPELEVLARFTDDVQHTPGEAVQAAADATGADRRELRQFVSRLRRGQRLAPGVDRWHYELPDHPGIDDVPAQDWSSDSLISLHVPLLLRSDGGRYECIDHEGRRILVLEPVEVAALAALTMPTTPAAAVESARRLGLRGFDDAAALHRLMDRTAHAGLLRQERMGLASSQSSGGGSDIDRDAIIREVFEHHAQQLFEAEAAREASTGVHRTNVVPVAFDMGTPAGLGMVVAAAKGFEGGVLEDTFCFRTDWVWSDALIAQLTREPAVYLFSNYLWSHERCIELSRRIKELSPGSVTIHGGPDTPKYERDVVEHFANYPHVDITVHGEGEISAAEVLNALAPQFGVASTDAGKDLSVLSSVAGITYRAGAEVVRTADRERIADLNTLPSPVLTGLYDVYASIPDLFVTLETNRGCPYGCTFCDWGSATTSRVRQYDLERVFAEIDWCGDVGVSSVSIADANFGMFKRDIEIAEKVAEVRRTKGAPPAFGVSYAKNTVKHLEHIIRTLAGAGIMAQGVLSLQTMDPATLEVIHRSNIKTERYDGIAGQMREAGLPLMIELMMGLPGQTLTSFGDDLQQCINREVPARVNRTTVLVNSPMNDPEYRREHQIETSVAVSPGANANIVSTASFTADDYAHMEMLRRAMLTFENFGVLRLVSRYVRHETGIREIDFYDRLRSMDEQEAEPWPALRLLTVFGYSIMAPPFSWSLLMDDLHRYLVDELELPDDSALHDVLRTQKALLPSFARTYPQSVELDHDVVAWAHLIQAAKAAGHLEDWQDVVPKLRTYGPVDFEVADPDGVADSFIGLNGEHAVVGLHWELESPLSRAHISATEFVDFSQMMPKFSESPF